MAAACEPMRLVSMYEHEQSPTVGSTRDHFAEHVERERPNAHLLTDVLTPMIVAGLWLVLPLDVTMRGRVVGAVLVAGLGALDRLVIRRSVPRHWQNYAKVIVRLGVALGFTGVLAELWYPVSVLLGCLTVGAIPAESNRRILALVGAAGLGLSATAIAFGVAHWYLSVAMLVVTALGINQWFRVWHANLMEINRRHDEMVDRARMFSWEIDRSTGTILSLAGNVQAVLGYEVDELVGVDVQQIIDFDAKDASGMRTERPDGKQHLHVRQATHRDGHTVTVREVRLPSRKKGVVRGVSLDISELARASDQLRHQAEHDRLTGLANREVLERVVTEALTSEEQRVALVLGDLDRFKEVNDTLGHPTGDKLLCVLAARFTEGLSDLDVIARLGGDEFAFVAVGDVDEARAREIAQRIHDLAAKPVSVDGVQLAVACSVGVAVSPDHGMTYEDLLKHADIATYQAKLSLGGVQVYESTPHELSVQRLELVSEVPRGLANDEFELHLQPKVNMATGELVGVEGLARWRHPRAGLMAPGEFLHVIEVAAGYHRFTEIMLTQAFEFAAKAHHATGEWCPVAVNIGSMSFLDRSLPDRLESLLIKYGIPASVVTLEVTESELLDENGADLPVFDAVKSMGIRLSIDDFGTGYSSLTRLRQLDVDEVKIDREFVQGLGRDPEDEIIVQAVVQLARLLGHSVVAEGVETYEQAAMLRDFGCTIAQGYLFSRPQPLAAILKSLRAGVRYDVGVTV